VIESLALAVVVLAASYLIGLAAASFLSPKLAAKFLDSFASSAGAHMAEMVIRLLVGWALVVYSPQMLYSFAFTLFGWVLVVTTVLLLLIPWRWHHKFAQVAVRPLTRRVWLFGVLSLPLGGIILFAVLGGSAGG
jgi:hypothetical protein